MQRNLSVTIAFFLLIMVCSGCSTEAGQPVTETSAVAEKMAETQKIITSNQEIGRRETDYIPVQHQGEYNYPDLSGKDSAIITKITDGDTYHVELNGDDITVRLIGVDTPDSVAPEDYRKENTEEGSKVSELVKEKIKIGDTVYLEYDTSESDRYGRTLAYVYFADGTMVQDWLLSNGYATVYTLEPDTKYAEHFEKLELQAKEQDIGIWSKEFIE